MECGDEVSTVKSANLARMPLKIVQGAQYMNDATGSVFGKFTRARNYQKNSEFRGGIWDCNPVEKTVSTEPSYVDLSNNFPNKIFSLDEMLACDNVEDDTEMKEDGDVANEHNKPTEVSIITSCTEVSVDVKNKRWQSEECDKASLETTRKKYKKNISFSDSLVDMETSSKPSGINKSSYKTVRRDVVVRMEDNLEVTVNFNESKQMKNSVMPSQDINDVPVKMEGNRSVPEEKTDLKESSKVKKWVQLMSQACTLEGQQLEERMQVKVESSEKLAKESSNKTKSNDCVAEHETILKSSDVNHEVKQEEFINRSRLEDIIPELFDLSESETMNKVEYRSTKKKDKMIQNDDDLIAIHNTEEERKISQSSKKNFSLKNNPSRFQMDLSENEEVSNSFEDESILKQKDEVHLKNLLTKFFNDSAFVDRIAARIVKLSEQKNKVNNMSEKAKNLSDDKQTDFFPMVRCDKSYEEKSMKKQACYSVKLSEDEFLYESENNTVQKEKEDCCPPVCGKPSCNQPSFERNGQMGKDLMKDKVTEGTDEKSGKVSPTAYQGKRNFNDSISRSRSDSCSNWRSQCIDAREKDMKENTVPQSSASANWKNERTISRNQHYKTLRDNHYSKRIENFKKQQEMNVLSKIEYVDDDPLVVIPLNLKEPPNPLTRFKVNTDPESIWDTPEEKKIPCSNNQTHLWNESTVLKNGSKAEEVHAQLFRKSKPTSVPIFFGNPTRTCISAKPCNELSEDTKHYSPKKIDSASLVKLNENSRSRSHSQHENFSHRFNERNRSSSVHRRRHLSSSLHDVFFIIKITNLQNGAVEKLKILKEDFLERKKENTKLSDIIPYPGYKPRHIAYSACAVIMFVRCVFSLSYKILNWMTVLEAFALAKKCGIEDLKKECQNHFMINKIPSEQMEHVAICAKQLQAVDALKFTNLFQKVENIKNFPDQNVYTPQSCSVSCAVLMEPSEFSIPLLSEVNRGLEACNETDVTNTLVLRSLTGVTCLLGLQLKFLSEDMHAILNIICEVFKNKEKLFFKYFDTRAKPSIKISFEDGIIVKYKEQIEICIIIEDVILKMCPQLTDNVISNGKFEVTFESSKSERNKKLFCIEKLFYIPQA